MNLSESIRAATGSKISQFTARVVENRPVSPSTYRMALALPPLDSLRIMPGQFFMMRTSPSFDPLLRRPFSILSVDRPSDEGGENLSILFRAVGQGTRLMAEWDRGQPVNMVGPLGRGFTIPETLGPVVMVAGGLGIASLFSLAESILLRERRSDFRVYIGGKSRDDILMKTELEGMGARVEVATEDGSMGMRGVVTHRLDVEAPRLAQQKDCLVYACGPLQMLARVAEITRRFSLSCQVSLESRMACGIGSCLGCAVRTRDKGYQMVCKDGPVFEAGEIDWKRTQRLL